MLYCYYLKKEGSIMTNKNLHKKILWITTTAMLLALLITLQWATAGTQAFAGQYITGTCVNAVLAVAALSGGFWCGAVVALASPFCAFLLGIGPKLLPIVPGIAAGNLVLVALLYLLVGKQKNLLIKGAGAVAASVAKFLTLFLLVNKVIVPWLGDTIPAKQAQTFAVMFSWPQLVTALLGCALALSLLPLLSKVKK